MLQETLAAAGESAAGAGTANVSAKRLACFVGLMRELLSAGAFGALQGLMATVLAELHNALYVGSRMSAEAMAEPLPEGWTPSQEGLVPFFAALAHTEAESQGTQVELERLRAKFGGGEDKQEQRIKLLQRLVSELQGEVDARDKELAQRREEAEDLQREKKMLAEQARTDHRSLISELDRSKDRILRMEQELGQYKGIAMQEEIARRAFHAVAQRMRGDAERDPAAVRLNAGEASKLMEQLQLLRNVRIDKYERQVQELGLRTICGEAFKMVGDVRVERVRDDFLQEVLLAQEELKVLKDHVAEIALENQIMRSAAGLMVRPDELEAFARRARQQQRKEDLERVSRRREGGPAGRSATPAAPGVLAGC